MFELTLTADGSLTFYSQEFAELYHSHGGAKQEAEEKFTLPCQLKTLATSQHQITIVDICYGLGYNSAAALAAIWSVNPACQVHLIALELDHKVPLAAWQAGLLQVWSESIDSYLGQLARDHYYQNSVFNAQLIIADARKSLAASRWQADAIFLDPFSPPKCPQLWTVEFCQLVARCLKPDGKLATYSSAASVRKALLLSGLQIGSTKGVGRRSPGTVASWSVNPGLPLSLEELEHLLTRAAVPYRDPTLTDEAIAIQKRRLLEQSGSELESTSQWKKRWQARRYSQNLSSIPKNLV